MLKIYVAAVVSLGSAATGLAILFGGSSGDVGIILALVALGAASERFKTGLFGESHVSLSAAVCMVAVIAGGTRDAVIVSLCLAIAVNLGGRVSIDKTAFNAASYILSTIAFAAIWQVSTVLSALQDWPGSTLPAIIAATGDLVANGALVGGAIAIANQRSFKAIAREKFVWLAPHYITLGAFAAAMAVAYETIGLLAVPTLGVGLMAVHFGASQYAELYRRSQEEAATAATRIAAVERELDRLQRAPAA